ASTAPVVINTVKSRRTKKRILASNLCYSPRFGGLTPMLTRRALVVPFVLAALVVPVAAQLGSSEKGDLEAIYRIKEEGLQRSKVMELESYLTDVYGPRLANSPEIREAGEWAQKTMKDWGLANVHEETWHFGRGWHNERMVALAVSPRAFPLIAYPKAWTPGTNGPVTGEAVIAVVQNEKDFDEYHGKLQGKFVLAVPMRDVAAHFDPLGRRYTDADLANIAKQPDSGRGRGRGPGGNFDPAFPLKRAKFWVDEGVAAVLDFSQGDGGTVFVLSGGSRDPKE